MRDWLWAGVKAQMCVTSPPYFGLRDYGVDGQLGAERTPQEYVEAMVETFRAVRDVLADDGTLWLNLGDSYARNPKKGNHKPGDAGKQNYIIERGNGRAANTGTSGLPDKSLLGIPWRVAFALQDDGWILRQDIIWSKPNPLTESVKDRCTKSHEYIFLLSKAKHYYFDHDAIQEPVTASTIARLAQPNLPNQAGSSRIPGKTNGAMKAVGNGKTRNKRSVWTVTKQPFKGSHLATFPPALIETCILAGSRPGDIVLDPFMGSGTTAGVALKHGRHYLGCELNPEYGLLHEARIAKICA